MIKRLMLRLRIWAARQEYERQLAAVAAIKQEGKASAQCLEIMRDNAFRTLQRVRALEMRLTILRVQS